MKIAFVFSGQGAQFTGMGKDLYDASPAAKKIFELADKVLQWSVSGLCFCGPDEKLTTSTFCQPAIYTTSMACLAAFQEKYPEIIPVGAAGLSLGEYAAFASSGYFSFEDGLKLIAKRGELMDAACRMTKGAMATALGAKPEDVEAVCRELDIDVANYNCPGQIVISGPEERVKEAADKIKAKGAKRVVVLNVAGAFHSRLMKHAEEELAPVLAAVKVNDMKYPVAQNFTGKLANAAEIKNHLCRQVSGSVHLDSCIETLTAECGAEAFIEFGPGKVVSGLIRKIDSSKKVWNVSSVPDLETVMHD